MNESNDSVIGRRPHLTKEQRLPNCYKEVEKIVKSVKSCQINFKTVLAKSRLRGSQFKKVYKLSLNVLKYYNYIQKIIDKLQLLKKEKFLRKEIAAVLIYELIFGNGTLPGESKAVTTIQAYQNDLMTMHQQLQSCNEDFQGLNEIYVPRYARVHTLVTTVACVIKDLQNLGFNQISYDLDICEEKFYQLVKNLEKSNFLIDFHFKDMLVFSQVENLLELDLYKNGHIFLQDKASYIPVHALNPEPGATVLDACAAPGMKSAHIASKMKNKGILIACERDESRFETLKETLKYGSVKISRTLCTDFKLLDPNDEAYSGVDYILLDPSCSGSGMVNRMDSITDTENSKTKERLLKLAGFQIILLKHALKFPSVKRVVYSTCSIHEEENEYVVQEVLNAFNGMFKLVPVLSESFDRGSESYNIGKMCLRTVPEKHLTNGFFVAMFERNEMHAHRRKNFSGKYFKSETVKKSDDIFPERDSLIMAYETLERTQNYDQDTEDITHLSLIKGDFKTPEYSKHKKKEKICMTNIQSQANEEDQEVFIIDSTQEKECENSEVSKNLPQMYGTVDNSSKVSKSEKKTTHKRHLISGNAFEKLGMYQDMSPDVRLKHKKKKKETDKSNSTEQLNNNSDVLDQRTEDYQSLSEDVNVVADSFSQKSKEPNALKFPKLKKRDKESKNKLKCNIQNQTENSKPAFSKLQQNSEYLVKFTGLPSSGDEVVGKIPMYKEMLRNDSEVIENYKIFDSSYLKHKKKKRKKEHSFEENITYTQDTEHTNEINSFENKPEKVKESSEFKLSCVKSNFENKNLKQDKNSSDTPLKEHKKHKHSKNSDLTPFQFNVLKNDFSKVHSNLENNLAIKSAEILICGSQNENTEKHYLTDNSKCKKSKKHKKHMSESNESDGTVFSSDRNPNCVANVIINKDTNQTVPSEEIYIKSSSQHHHHNKKKGNENEKAYDSVNFQHSNTKKKHIKHDLQKILEQNGMQSITLAENDCIERKERKKCKKLLADVSEAPMKRNSKEHVSITVINPMDTCQSEVGSKNHSTKIKPELENLSQSKEPENILFNSRKKKKKKDKK